MLGEQYRTILYTVGIAIYCTVTIYALATDKSAFTRPAPEPVVVEQPAPVPHAFFVFVCGGLEAIVVTTEPPQIVAQNTAELTEELLSLIDSLPPTHLHQLAYTHQNCNVLREAPLNRT